jgi:acetyltransferase-like isoleucine patch superfamily enzyme
MLKGAKVTVNELKIGFGSIKIGMQELLFSQRKTRSSIINKGSLYLGSNISIYCGFCCTITKTGKLYLGNNTKFGSNSKIVCMKEITVCDFTRFAFECLIFDTNFHYIENIEEKNHNQIAKNITINKFCWIGSRTIINSGTILPSNTIVASSSLLNKDYSVLIQENSLLAGIPAKFIKTGVRRIWNTDLENELIGGENLSW